MLSKIATSQRGFATTFKKVQVANPVVDMDGDEMTRVIWGWIKERVWVSQCDQDVRHKLIYFNGDWVNSQVNIQLSVGVLKSCCKTRQPMLRQRSCGTPVSSVRFPKFRWQLFASILRLLSGMEQGVPLLRHLFNQLFRTMFQNNVSKHIRSATALPPAPVHPLPASSRHPPSAPLPPATCI